MRLIILPLTLFLCGNVQGDGRPSPTHGNVSYGPHERNVLDFWRADSEEPTPLVLYIHGGGFRAGKKENFRTEELRSLLDAGISFASVNYRYIDHAALPASLYDCRRALQFLRNKADDWNIDKSRIAGYGGSAGAITCMYLGFHDDMAEPSSPDPIARESTRLACIAAKSGQVTLDLTWWRDNLPGAAEAVTPVSGGPLEFSQKKDPAAFQRAIEECSALNIVSTDDPPIWLAYGIAPDDPAPKNPQDEQNWRVHHVAFGVALKKVMDDLNLEAYLVYPNSPNREYGRPVEFLIAMLKADAGNWTNLFNGKDLSGWVQRNGTASFRAEQGVIVGKTSPGSPNSFLCTEQEFGDFELTFEVKVDQNLNSGVQIRSHSSPNYKNGRVHGPQVEIEVGPGEAGYLYSEGTGEGWISKDLTRKTRLSTDSWNRYRVLVKGHRISTWVNGVRVENLVHEKQIPSRGFLALQVHAIPEDKGPYEVRWRKIRIRNLP